MSYIDLDMPLAKLSAQGDVLTPRTGAGGIHYWGGIGGGKTSAAHMVAGAYLRAGMGGYVTVSKFEDIAMWKDNYASKHGRGRSIILFDENEGFNFLEYEMSRQGFDGIGSVTECLMRVIDTARKASATASHRGGEVFWEDATREALRYTLPPLFSAKGSLSIPDIIRFISTAPTNVKEPTDPEWQRCSFMYEVMNRATRCPRVPMPRAAMENTIRFWAERWPASPDKTRGNVVMTVNTTLDRFNHGRLNRVFCGKTTIVPDMSFHGAIIVDAKPTLTWNEDGVIAQQLFKYFWQRSVLGRNSLEKKHRERFLFLWSDEAQETVLPEDGPFLSLCRASRCCVTYLTQSLPNYYAKMGGDNPHDAAHALAGKFNTHVFCSNSCPETNEFAARILGKVVTRRSTFSNGTSESVNSGMNAGNSENSGFSSNYGASSSGSWGGQGSRSSNSGSGHSSGSGNNWGSNRGRATSENISRGYSESTEYSIEPGYFARGLRTGGPQNNNIVTAIWFEAGRVFRASGTNWLLARFKQ
jgi:hypothetical protein